MCSRSVRRTSLWLVLLACASCTQTQPEEEAVPTPIPIAPPGEALNPSTAPTSIAPRRSLAVTETATLAGFSLQRVLDQLVSQSAVPGLTSLALFQQWWDTQNPGPGLGRGPHCDDSVDAQGQPTLNGYPYSCRPAPSEGAQATVDPFVNPGQNPNEYVAIGLFNRFDLAPADGSHCGEYRIVYARRAGITSARARNLVIVEAALGNPHPQQGLKGCRKIVDFWVALSGVADRQERARQLERFYFDGIPSVRPVIHIDHLGAGPTGAGQIRSNQFMAEGLPGQVWSLRQYALRRTCSGPSTCSAMTLVPVPAKNTAFGGLFNGDYPFPQAAAFQAWFLDQIPGLAADTLAGVGIDIAPQFTSGQSQAAAAAENNFIIQFQTAPTPFRVAIQARLTSLGSALTPEDLIARAQFLSCAGCHRLSGGMSLGGGLVAPRALGFVHVSERDTELVDQEPAFKLSDALSAEFLPARAQVIVDYLGDKLKAPKNPKDPIGGLKVH